MLKQIHSIINRGSFSFSLYYQFTVIVWINHHAFYSKRREREKKKKEPKNRCCKGERHLRLNDGAWKVQKEASGL